MAENKKNAAAEAEVMNMAEAPQAEAADTTELATIPRITDLSTLASAKASEKIRALAHVTSYVGAKTVDVNDFLGRVLAVKGVVIHTATIGHESNEVDENGERVVSYESAERVVFKLEDNTVLGFVSKAAASFAQDFIIPLFGQGDFLEDGEPVTVPIKVSQISTKRGRSYNFQVVL